MPARVATLRARRDEALSGNALGVRPLGVFAGNFGRGAQCGIEHPFAPVDFLAHVQDY